MILASVLLTILIAFSMFGKLKLSNILHSLIIYCCSQLMIFINIAKLILLIYCFWSIARVFPLFNWRTDVTT